MTLQLTYIGLALLMTIILTTMGIIIIKLPPNQSKAQRNTMLLLGSLTLYHVYIFFIAKTEILQDYSLPPKGPAFLLVPAFLFIGVFIYKNRNKDWIQKIPAPWLIFYQTFRILIEIIFVFSVAKGVLHRNMTIEGYNYDMLFALSAPLIGFWLLKGSFMAQRIAILWNYLGLFVIASIIFIVVTTTYFPEFWGSNRELMPKEFVMYPYIIVPAFLMPSAVFIHVLSIVQLRKRKQLVTNS